MASRPDLPAALRGRAFGRAEALANGLSRTTLGSGRIRTLFGGVYVYADVEPTLELLIDGARLVLPDDAAATHRTGLQHHGVEIGSLLPLHFATTHRNVVRRDGIRVIRRMSMPRHVDRVLTPADCWLDACVDFDLLTAVVVGDWLVRLGHTDVDRLTRFVDSIDNWEGVKLAREAVRLVRAGSESPRETYVRLMLVLAGLPEPACNVDVVVEGIFLGRGDLVYVAYRVLVEYDGRQHAEDAHQWNRDLDRLDGFADHDWLCERVTNRRLNDPRRVVLRVYELLRRRGYAGPPPQFDELWCRLFERRSWAP